MSSIAHTSPRTGRRNFNLRAYLAGTAATAALIGAVVLAFASLGAYVAFNGLPVGGDDDAQASSVAVEPAVGAASATQSRNGQDVGTAQTRRAQGSGSRGSGTGGNATATSQSGATAAAPTVTPASGNEPTVATGGAGGAATPNPAQTGPSANPPSQGVPTPHVTAPSSVGGAVGIVEQTIQDSGLGAPLSGAGAAVDDVAGGLVGGN